MPRQLFKFETLHAERVRAKQLLASCLCCSERAAIHGQPVSTSQLAAMSTLRAITTAPSESGGTVIENCQSCPQQSEFHVVAQRRIGAFAQHVNAIDELAASGRTLMTIDNQNAKTNDTP